MHGIITIDTDLIYLHFRKKIIYIGRSATHLYGLVENLDESIDVKMHTVMHRLLNEMDSKHKFSGYMNEFSFVSDQKYQRSLNHLQNNINWVKRDF